MTTVVKTDEWFVVRAIARFEPAADSEMALAKNEEVVARYYSEHGSWMKAARLGDGGNVVDSGLIPASFVRLLNVRPFFVFFSDSFVAFFFLVFMCAFVSERWLTSQFCLITRSVAQKTTCPFPEGEEAYELALAEAQGYIITDDDDDVDDDGDGEYYDDDDDGEGEEWYGYGDGDDDDDDDDDVPEAPTLPPAFAARVESSGSDGTGGHRSGSLLAMPGVAEGRSEAGRARANSIKPPRPARNLMVVGSPPVSGGAKRRFDVGWMYPFVPTHSPTRPRSSASNTPTRQHANQAWVPRHRLPRRLRRSMPTGSRCGTATRWCTTRMTRSSFRRCSKPGATREVR